jgi:eukaryotic-like serine/threonine-protein kinase
MPPSEEEPGDGLKQPAQLEAPISERARWNLITELVGQAWDMEGTDRNAFLAQACDSDPALYAEVRGLLAEQESVSYFMEGDVLEERLPKGARLGFYLIEDKIGEGGMGVVYRGRDDRLGRDVAIKTIRFLGLPVQKRRAQFLHEARTTAALNHPHIVTIHDVGSATDVDFIVMEYLRGRTLDRLMNHEALQVGAALRIAEQVADALQYAHSKKVIHRDLKPGNIVLTEDHSVKVLDFGLAIHIGQVVSVFDHEARSGTMTGLTMSSLNGRVVGTVSYMSPEQADGRTVDERSDLFSLGCVLYEMITGSKAFHSGDAAATLAKIRETAYKPVREIIPDLPGRLEKLITDCLQSDPQRRPQSAAQVREILTAVRSELEGRGRSLKRVALAMAAALVAVSGLLPWLKYVSRPSASGPVMFALPLTGSSVSEFGPSVSPDSRSVVYSADGLQPGKSQVLVKPVGGGEIKSLTNGLAEDTNPVWSPDGTRIAFLRTAAPDVAEVWTVAAGGGDEHHIATSAGALCWPKENWLIFSSRASPAETKALYRFAISSGDKVRITDPETTIRGDTSPEVSPGGRFLAFIRVSTWNTSSLYVQPLKSDLLPGGTLRKIDTGTLQPSDVTWGSSGNELIFAAGFADHSLWRIGVAPGSKPQRLNIIGADDGLQPSASSGGVMAFARIREEAGIWKLDLNESHSSSPQQVISSLRMNVRPQYSPDGQKISFISLRSGYAEIWVSDANGQRPTQLTAESGPTTGDPFWSPDGRFLAFNAAPEGQYDIYKIAAAGGTLVRLTHDPSMDVRPSWSRDGNWIYFASNRSGGFHIYKVPAGGGEPTRVTEHPGFASLESEDGRYLYFTDADTSEAGLWQLDKEGGREEQLGLSMWHRNFALTPNGVYFEKANTTGKSPELWFYNLHDRKKRLVQKLEGDASPGFLSLSPDGRSLLFAKYKLESHIMVVKGFE